MKNTVNLKNNLSSASLTLKLLLGLTTLITLVGCGNSKTANNNNNNNLNIYSQQVLARCTKTTDTNFTFNLSTVVDLAGQPSNDYIKIKFSRLSETMTAAGNVIKFFKWRIVGGTPQLDGNAINFAAYDLGSGPALPNSVASINAAEISASSGYYLQLNDPTAAYQALKVVVYNSAGSVVGQINSLIPAFLASPVAYQLNTDGTVRASVLQQMHPLVGVDVSAWTPQQLQQNFDQYCF